MSTCGSPPGCLAAPGGSATTLPLPRAPLPSACWPSSLALLLLRPRLSLPLPLSRLLDLLLDLLLLRLRRLLSLPLPLPRRASLEWLSLLLLRPRLLPLPVGEPLLLRAAALLCLPLALLPLSCGDLLLRLLLRLLSFAALSCLLLLSLSLSGCSRRLSTACSFPAALLY